MDQQNSAITPSEEPPNAEGVDQIGANERAILESKEKREEIKEAVWSKETVNDEKHNDNCVSETQSAPIVDAQASKDSVSNDMPTNNKIINDVKFERSSSLDSKDDRIEKNENTYPNEACKDEIKKEENCILVDKPRDRENITVEINERKDILRIDVDSEKSVVQVSQSSVIKNAGDNFDDQQDCEIIEVDKPIDRNESKEQVVPIVGDSRDKNMEEKVAVDPPIIVIVTEAIDEPSNRIESEAAIDQTTKITELNPIHDTKDKIGESVTEILETMEIVIQTNDAGSNKEELIEIGTSELTNNKISSSAVNIESDESPMEIDEDENFIPDEKQNVDDNVKKNPQDKEHVRMGKTLENDKTLLETIQTESALSDTRNKKINDSTSSEMSASSDTPMKQRSVIEDIFDDWQDENPEEESCQSLSKAQDNVEMELKILLHDEKSADAPCTEQVEMRISERSTNKDNSSNLISSSSHLTNERTTISEALQFATNEANKESEKHKQKILPIEETTRIHVESRKTEKTNETPVSRERLIKQKPLAPRPGVKVPGILLTSPIVSKSAVSKVLKERIREQQKEFDSPTKPDIFFVKKITQRLSHKLAAASAAQVPGLVPLSQTGGNTDSNRFAKSSTVCEAKKTTSDVDKELLAILEGDVDPDWSNLKPPSLVVDAKPSPAVTTDSAPPKLDPLIERELALKQLLELPSSPAKKITVKKTPVKPARTKILKITKTTIETKKDVDAEVNKPEVKRSEMSMIEMNVKEDSVDSNSSIQELKLDETRSGRKRKPTEKAREHENSTKRMKVFKGKVSGNKRNGQEDDHSPVVAAHQLTSKNDTLSSSVTEIIEEVEDEEENRKINTTNETPKKSVEYPISEDSDDSVSDELVVKKVKTKPNVKRKIPGQKLIRQKIVPNKKSTMSVKSKFPKGIAKKSGAKLTNNKGQKQRNGESSNTETKPKKKVINEIDRLLQDEGVVNLLYDVEQPDKKRLVPITKSQTKVMDLQKIQRELKIRTKLVRNAVLRLRTSTITTNKVSPRSKRSISNSSSDLYTDKKSNEQTRTGQSSSPTDFIYPAKIRNAADASIIIRRHSSSSFSSASASPRASIDAPERLSIDGGKYDDSGMASHGLRSNKRRHSQEEDKKKKKPKQSPEPKRNRRKISDRSEPEVKNNDKEIVPIAGSGSKNKSAGFTSIPIAAGVPAMPGSFTNVKSPKKLDAKKNPKTLKQQQNVEVIDVDENNGSIRTNAAGKITTRSNGSTGGGKIMPKSKKSVKCKVTFAKGNDSVNKKMESPEQQDELSACLAEAVTALSNDSGGPSRSRSTIPVNRNKTKGNSSSVVKSLDDEIKPKTETRVQFSNNEINVQRHGNLVQLLLTPSTPTKIRNGITLQVMQEIRETLAILKKDEDCRVVLLTSTGTSFCEGLELSTLLHDNKEERRLRAEELANAVKEFIKSLATFNKPIVAGVQGTAVGLGVTMLPWFDLVIASDKATFSTPYGKLGQIAEGAAIFTLSHILGSAVTSELLLGGRTLTASEALRAGLVTRVLWPDRFQAELLPSLRSMSEQSSQSMEATKALLRHSLRKKLDAALESESYLLVQHWCSAECQAAITAYVDEKIQ